MSHIFISYSRRDQEVTRRLHDALKEQGHESWVDWEGIMPSAEWLQEIYTAIDAADFFLFLISPDSITSEVCAQEVAHAAASHKRLVPLLIRDVNASNVPPVAAIHNWIYCRESDDFDEALRTLFKALDTDIDWVHAHTRLLTRAKDWEIHKRDAGFALHGHDLQTAEQWLSLSANGKQPHPTSLQADFILASRKNASRRQRTITAAVLVSVFIALLLGFNAWEHAQRGRILEARELYTQALGTLNENDPGTAEVLLAESLALDDRRETRERFLEAHAKTAPLEWAHFSKADNRLLAISADGSRFALRNAAHRIEIWDSTAHKHWLTLPTMVGKVLCVSFSRDDRWLAIGCDNSLVYLWELSSAPAAPKALLRRTLHSHVRAVRCVTFSPDDRLLASAGKGRNIRLWDVASGRQLRVMSGHREQILCLAFSPDGKMLASGSWGNDVWLWDVKTGRKLRELHGHEDAVFGIAFSPDGKTLASASWDTTLWLWDTQNGERLRQLSGHHGGVLAVTFSSDGREVLSSGEDGTARLWNSDTGRETLTLRGQDSYVRYVALGRGQSDVVAGSENGTVRVWNVLNVGERPEILTLRGHQAYVRSVVLSPDGTRLVSGSEDLSVRQWDTRKGRPLRVLSGHQRGVSSLSYRPDGKQFASAAKDGTVRLWDNASGRCGLILRHPAPVRHVEFSPCEPLIAVACDDGKVYFWRADSGKLVRMLSGHSDMVLCVGFSPDGQLLASSGEDHRVLLWDVVTGRKIATLRGHLRPVWKVLFSDDRHLFACGEDEGVRVWDIKSRTASGLLKGHKGPVWDLSWDRTRHRLASGGQDGTIRLWRFDEASSSWQDTRVLRASSGPICAVSYSRDGTRLAAGSQDGTARIWQLDQIEGLLTQPATALVSQARKETGLYDSDGEN